MENDIIEDNLTEMKSMEFMEFNGNNNQCNYYFMLFQGSCLRPVPVTKVNLSNNGIF